MILVVRKPTFCICENKEADQLRGNREADQRLCFRYTDSTIPLLPIPNFKPQANLCGCTAWFVWGLVGNPEDRFSHNEVHIIRTFFNIEVLKYIMGHVMRKPVFGVSEQVQHKPGCTATDA